MKAGLIVTFVLLTFPALAGNPPWWSDRNVLDAGQSNLDYHLANLGQLKWIATNACAEMDEYFGAGMNVMAVITNFSNPTNSLDNYYLCTIGQLKYVAKPFYLRLQELALTNTLPKNMPSFYPWGGSSNTNDYVIATIGQVKYAFSFDSSVDSDSDGLVDWAEVIYGTNPYNPDSDDDGIIDGDEIENGSDPLDPNSTEQEDWDALRETDRQKIIQHWWYAFGSAPTFTNTAGSQADLNDMRDALNALSGIFYELNN